MKAVKFCHWNSELSSRGYLREQKKMSNTRLSLTERQKSRGQWKRPIEFVLSLSAFAIGLASIWRFPYLAMKNGGGAFLVPYILFATVIGIPVVFLETAFGQYFQTSPLLIFDMCPLFRGIDNLGEIRWQLLIPLIVAFGLICVCIFKGIESSRIAVYITATVPFLLLILFLGWLLTRRGSSDGLLFYITPHWEHMMTLETWFEAFLHAFHSLVSGLGATINLASYNPFHHNCLRDSVIVTVLDTATAIVCGAVVFAGVGCIAYQTGANVTDVITTGPGLSFVVYPQLATSFPLPHLWAVCFYLLLLFLGIDGQFVMVKTITTGLTDLFPETLGKRRPLVIFVVLIISLVFALPFITRGGIYAFHIVDWYATLFTVTTIVTCECIVIGWLYGVDRFLGNIQEMGSFAPQWVFQFMKISWKFIIPFCVLSVLIIAIVKFRPPSYGDYTYPDWTNGMGWLLAVIWSVPIPVVMIYTLAKSEGTLIERLKLSIQPRIGRMGLKQEDVDVMAKNSGTHVRDSKEELAMLSRDA